MISADGHEYPVKEVRVFAFPADLTAVFPKPKGLVEDVWPPTQLFYLKVYIGELGCKTVVVENHYIDRDYIQDVAVFYSRSLRSYPNYCQRLHFFTLEFEEKDWRRYVVDAAEREKVERDLNAGYLGFCVVRPLPGSPVGRTVLRTMGRAAKSGMTRHFTAVRPYDVHLGGFNLNLQGLAFQQQDQGVSACATTALWSSLQKTAFDEDLAVPSPAEITESASRYLLSGGRSLPSEGLTIQQICEAARASGLEPIVYGSVSLQSDRAQLYGYLSSGFAPVVAIRSQTGDTGHAVCAVGMKLSAVEPQPNPDLNYRDASTALRAVYVHDDRLGPYASAEMGSYTLPNGKLATSVLIRWPDKDIVAEHSILTAIIVPLPPKIRMSLHRIRALGHNLAEAAAVLFPIADRSITLDCKYVSSREYQEEGKRFNLGERSLYDLLCNAVLSRYVGLIRISSSRGPLFDALLDATETRANPSALLFVKRSGLQPDAIPQLEEMARNCGARLLT